LYLKQGGRWLIGGIFRHRGVVDISRENRSIVIDIQNIDVDLKVIELF